MPVRSVARLIATASAPRNRIATQGVAYFGCSLLKIRGRTLSLPMAYEKRDVLRRPELNEVTEASMLMLIKVTVPAVPNRLFPNTMCGIGVPPASCSCVSPVYMAVTNRAYVTERSPIAHIIPLPMSR